MSTYTFGMHGGLYYYNYASSKLAQGLADLTCMISSQPSISATQVNYPLHSRHTQASDFPLGKCLP